ncbi:MAG TPA: site-specific integrase, partial [Methylomirabilota bacterium]|nr:site-specific integrase [Methylomirabilota bacterium]
MRSPATEDKLVLRFLQHLATDRGASAYTQRNYRQALLDFEAWHREERKTPARWDGLQRDDFRAFLRFLGRRNLSRPAIQLRFCALRTFYKFLIRTGMVGQSPIRNLVLPKAGRRLPKFLTAQQVKDLLAAPLKLLPGAGSKPDRELLQACCRDLALLETIYSCG